jgi:hypothetical protein
MNHNSMSITQWYWHLHNARIMHNNQVKAKIFAHTEYPSGRNHIWSKPEGHEHQWMLMSNYRRATAGTQHEQK